MCLAILDWPTFAASFWLLLLITAVSALSGISQLAFMIVLVREAIRDSLTGCFSRNSGEELLGLQFNLSERNVAPLTVAFIDLDHFKQVNDRFGHDAGDRVLVNAVAALRNGLRTGDILIRWGGEEFILILPGISADQACTALARMRAAGFGQRPDGTPVTASMGIAERLRDKATDWQQLVARADARMYEAKQGGRDRIVGCS
jgi:diguanylate cyclase (GGDEF)-like protein